MHRLAALTVLTALGLLSIAGAGAARAVEIAPSRSIPAPGGPIGHYSESTITAAIEVDRDGATLLAYTRKARPFERAIDAALATFATRGEDAVLDVALLGPKDARYSLRIPVQGICFDHDAAASAHVEGDTIRLHRESYIIELPELAGFDRIEIARESPGGLGARVSLGVVTLTPERFTAAGGEGRYEDLAFASASAASSGPSGGPGLTAGAVHWPDEFGDPDKYTLWGDASEVDKRINIVLVPDGYTYADKATMQAHAQAMVNYFRNKTPYAEHDPFINYILVYAYSTQNGTDQCDCSVVHDTAMATRFPLSTPTCGHSDNRCLFYGNGNGGPNCDPNVSTANIAAAELRAPAKDISIVMVNTTRYGGCGGARAVYSAGNGSATEIAVHELGHSLAGLADEYAYTAGCGTSAGEVNTSRNATIGAWPEWIGDLGSPFQGAQYYQSCLYRPENSCVMQALGLPFCRVCRQQWSLRFFSHFRINPTAPIASLDPPGSLSTQVGLPKTFTALTRLSILGATNDFTWNLQGPGFPSPTTVFTDGPAYTRVFQTPGNYALTLELIADTNFVKKERNGPNRDVATWYILATEVPEVSNYPTRELMLTKNGENVDMTFSDSGSTHYNLYVSTNPATFPFAVASPISGKKECGLAVKPAGPGLLGVANYDLNAGIEGVTGLFCVLVTADNGAGTEGTLGHASNGAPRTADAACNP